MNRLMRFMSAMIIQADQHCSINLAAADIQLAENQSTALRRRIKGCSKNNGTRIPCHTDNLPLLPLAGIGNAGIRLSMLRAYIWLSILVLSSC